MNDVIGHGMSSPCGTSVRAILPTHGVYLLPCSSLAMVTSQRRKCVVPWIWQFTRTLQSQSTPMSSYSLDCRPFDLCLSLFLL